MKASWTTADLSLAYRFKEDDILSGTRLGLNVQNITDVDAPIILSGTSLNTSYDGRVHNPFGRTAHCFGPVRQPPGR